MKKEHVKVKDHCYITGKYSSSAHNELNINLSLTKIIPIVFHHLGNYDPHPILQELGRYKINVIPRKIE